MATKNQAKTLEQRLLDRQLAMMPTIGVERDLREYGLDDDYLDALNKIRNSRKDSAKKIAAEITFREVMRFAIDFQVGVRQIYRFSSYEPKGGFGHRFPIDNRDKIRKNLEQIMRECFENIDIISQSECKTHTYIRCLELDYVNYHPGIFSFLQHLDNHELEQLVLRFVLDYSNQNLALKLLSLDLADIEILDIATKALASKEGDADLFFREAIQNKLMQLEEKKNAEIEMQRRYREQLCQRIKTKYGTEKYNEFLSRRVRLYYLVKSLTHDFLQNSALALPHDVNAIEYLLDHHHTIFATTGKPYSPMEEVSTTNVKEQSPLEFIRYLGYLLFVTSRADTAMLKLNEFLADEQLWDAIRAGPDKGKITVRGEFVDVLRQAYVVPRVIKSTNITAEVLDLHLHSETYIKDIFRNISEFLDVMFEANKPVEGYMKRFSDGTNRIRSYLTHPERFTHLQVESESECFIDDLGENERLHSCAFGPDGRMRAAVLDYLCDENIGFLKLVPYDRRRRLAPIAVAIIVNTNTKEDGTGENVWVVDSFEGGRYIRRIKGLDNRYGIMFKAIKKAAEDSPLKPVSVIFNTQFPERAGLSAEAKNFRNYALHKAGASTSQIENGKYDQYLTTQRLYKPQNPELNRLIGANRLLEAWYTGKKGSEWNTGQGEVTGIEIKLDRLAA